MRVQVSNIFILVFVILRNICHAKTGKAAPFVIPSTILCSQCKIKDDPKCEEDPPNAQPCFDPGDGIPQACSIIRTFNDDEQINFMRSCSTAEESGCFVNPNSGHKICAKICMTDYCNGPSSSVILLNNSVLLFCVLLIGLLLKEK